MPEPRLSIVTVTYNDAKGLSDTIESLRVLNYGFATGCSWEHVIVDSSAEVNSKTLLTLRDSGWPLVHVTAPAEGVYAAINTGLARAQGKYIWFLNGGDRLRDVNALNAALQAFQQGPGVDLVASGVELQRDRKYLYLSRPYPQLARNLVGMNRLCHQGVIYRREIFKQTGEYSRDFKIAADYEHHLKCVAAGMRARALPANLLAIYDMSGRSMDFHRAFAEFRQVQHKMRKQLPTWLNVANEIVRPLEFARISVQKYLGQSKVGYFLKPLWLLFKRIF